MDSIFLLTIGFIFLGALLSNIMKWRNKDRVLKDLQGFHATIERQDGKKIWGKTHIYTNGIELHFSRSVKNDQGNPISSYIFHHDDIDQIRAIFRKHSELSKHNQEKREHEILAVTQPSLWMIILRNLRIFFNMFNDAIGEALNVFLSRMKGGKSSGNIFDTQTSHLKKIGTTALSAVGNSYDPILEKYINKRVVVSLKQEDYHEKYCGFLKEYSSAWLSILDCRLHHSHQIDLNDVARLSLQRDMDFNFHLYEKTKGKLALDVNIHYFGEEPLKLIAVTGEKYKHNINKHLKKGESVSFSLTKLPKEELKNSDLGTSLSLDLLPLDFEMIAEERSKNSAPNINERYQNLLPDFKLELESTHISDVYLPRNLAILRHASVSTQ